MSTTRRKFLQLSGAAVGLALCPSSVWAGFDPLWKPGSVPERPIDTSVLELFKIGPGPSSSHTIAPMKAANDFVELAASSPPDALAGADKITVRLFNSLSSTGVGHHTDKAVAAGLMGEKPETCRSEILDGLFVDKTQTVPVDIGSVRVPFSYTDIVFEKEPRKAPFSDVFIISLHAGDRLIAEREYYSVGGGFVQWKGWREQERGRPRHRFDSMNGLLELCSATGLGLPQLMLENEQDVTGMDAAKIRRGVADMVEAMEASVIAGLAAEGPLEGPFGLHRRAGSLYRAALRAQEPEDRFAGSMSAYAFAAAEENSQGHRIVTAPTAGSAGVMPAVVRTLLHDRKIEAQRLFDGMLAAAAVGMLVKRHASVAGADVGCQGEIGVASAMGAALLAQVFDGDPAVVENAAENALEHHLGLTCDPVGGYVQIPCIARCAMGAVKAWNAWVMAKNEKNTFHPVGLDLVIRTMAATGRDMDPRYRETSAGGLALYYTQGC